MKTKVKGATPTFRVSLTRATRAIYLFIAIYMISIILFDSGNLITRESIIERWTQATALLIINTFVWFSAPQTWPSLVRKLPIILLTSALIVFAGFSTYWERGMASNSTIFYAFPILVIATARNRHALFATATTAFGVYTFAAVKYFNDFFNEGYRIQLWGTIVLVGGSIATVTWLTLILVGLKKESN